MITVRVICVGKLKEAYLRAACEEYVKRLGAFCRIEVMELSEHRLPENPSPAQIVQGLDAEGQAILQRCTGVLSALCIEGKALSSPELAEWMTRQALSGRSELDFVIGSSWGLREEVKGRASLRLSMSPMTFPHQLARVMLLEQIYRAFQINSGGKYHK